MSTDKPNTASSEAESIRATITSKLHVQIDRLNEQTPWTQEIHAVNWFNTRWLPLYNFYNRVASRSVAAVGGKPVFKGRLTKTLVGNDQDLRTVLLIVNYPSPLSFQTMLENTYFKIVSLLRAAAVKQFTFCFTQRIDRIDSFPVIDHSYHYAIHHFRGDEHVNTVAKNAPRPSDVELIFSSVKTHQLKTVSSNGKTTPVPDLMDGVLLYRATDASSLEAMASSEQYQSLIKQTDSSFIGLLDRLL